MAMVYLCFLPRSFRFLSLLLPAAVLLYMLPRHSFLDYMSNFQCIPLPFILYWMQTSVDPDVRLLYVRCIRPNEISGLRGEGFLNVSTLLQRYY